MNLPYKKNLSESLKKFENASPYDPREIETCMESLATQITLLMEAENDEPDSLDEAIELLPFDTNVKGTLQGIYHQIQELLELSDYDGADEEYVEDSLSEAISDFVSAFKSELPKIK